MRARVGCLLALGLLAGCAADSPNRYYDLSAVGPAFAPRTGGQGGRLHLAALSLPLAVDRPQLVERTGPNSIAIKEFDRWAEPLDRMAQRVLAQDLALRSGLAAAGSPDLPVYVAVDEFIAGRDGQARLSGRWWTRASIDDRAPPQAHAFSFVEPVEHNKAEGQEAAALSRLLARLADEIARA